MADLQEVQPVPVKRKADDTDQPENTDMSDGKKVKLDTDEDDEDDEEEQSIRSARRRRPTTFDTSTTTDLQAGPLPEDIIKATDDGALTLKDGEIGEAEDGRGETGPMDKLNKDDDNGDGESDDTECGVPEAKPNYAASPMVKVLVGKNKVLYHVYKEKLVSSCQFFEKCLSVGMKESHTDEIELPEERCGTFNQFVCYLYEGRVRAIEGNASLGDNIEAWLMAGKYAMTEWQNAIVNAMIRYFGSTYLEVNMVIWVSEKCEKGSLLHKLMMERLAFELVKHYGHYRQEKAKLDILMEIEGMSASDIIDLIMSERARLMAEDQSRPGAREPCRYHAHPDGNRCRSR
ncbi:hypothetical protein H2200_011874 [Cladophialophora chaetospira]|uniref:BTB domain-containing protein n=1 Tax=Cladophialophora chaetospira TaxID=386627 RepID=A0AA38WZ01_9EURO|nr:hypothetical protein H2200_011874 [Cladophialophora chaetospira]